MSDMVNKRPRIYAPEDYIAVVDGSASEGLADAITLFRDEHYFLSNMFPLRQGVETPDGIVVPSVEIGYHADRFKAPARLAVLQCVDGYAASRRSKKLRKPTEESPAESSLTGWEESRIDVMRWYTRQKFGRNPDVAEMLAHTEDRLLVEGNNWGDTFWGVSTVKGGAHSGRNELGKLLMETRTLLFEGRDLRDAAEETLESSEFLKQRRENIFD